MKRRDLLKYLALPSVSPLVGCANSLGDKSRGEFCLDAASNTQSIVCSDFEVATPVPGLGFLQLNPINHIRVGLIGLGQRGMRHLDILANFEFVTVVSICDLREIALVEANARLKEKGRSYASVYASDKKVYAEMLFRENLDLVVISTHWESHVEISLDSMASGASVAVEVPAALSIDECWQLVSAAETHSRHFIMLENVNYFRNELMVLNAVRNNAIGTPVYAECAYIHDLRHNLLNRDRNFPEYWRVKHHVRRNGNLYPTHGLGPVANYLDINRGNRFVSINSVSSKAHSLGEYAESLENSPFSKQDFICGDYNSSIIKTARGETIYLSFSTGTPRPYSRVNLLQGSRGVFEGFPEQYYLDNPQNHKWLGTEQLYSEFEHPLWREWFDQLSNIYPFTGHGGGDSVMWYKILQDLLNGNSMDMTVYDAVCLSAVSQLTEISNSRDGESIQFPDFTRGKWKNWQQENYQGVYS